LTTVHLGDRSAATDHASVIVDAGIVREYQSSIVDDVTLHVAPATYSADLEGTLADSRISGAVIAFRQHECAGAGLHETSVTLDNAADLGLRHRAAGVMIDPDHVAGCTGQLHGGCPEHRVVGRGGAKHERVAVGDKPSRAPRQRVCVEIHCQIIQVIRIIVGGREAAVAHPSHRTEAHTGFRHDRALKRARGLQHAAGENQAATVGEPVDWCTGTVIVDYGKHSLLNAGAAGVLVIALEA